MTGWGLYPSQRTKSVSLAEDQVGAVGSVEKSVGQLGVARVGDRRSEAVDSDGVGGGAGGVADLVRGDREVAPTGGPVVCVPDDVDIEALPDRGRAGQERFHGLGQPQLGAWRADDGEVVGAVAELAVEDEEGQAPGVIAVQVGDDDGPDLGSSLLRVGRRLDLVRSTSSNGRLSAVRLRPPRTVFRLLANPTQGVAKHSPGALYFSPVAGLRQPRAHDLVVAVAGKHVEVQVEYCLKGGLSACLQHVHAFGAESRPGCPGQHLGGPGNCGDVIWLGVEEIPKVPARHHQGVAERAWRSVEKCYGPVVVPDHCGWLDAGNDPAEDAALFMINVAHRWDLSSSSGCSLHSSTPRGRVR